MQLEDTVAEGLKSQVSHLLGLKSLGVPCTVDSAVNPLAVGSALTAARLVVNEIRKEIDKGLPIVDVCVQRLDDYDAGQWSEIVFLVRVDLNTKEANECWDKIIGRITALAESQEDESLKTALSEKISAQFRWH